MAAIDRGYIRTLATALLLGVSACALLPAVQPSPALAQSNDLKQLEPQIPEDAKLMLSSTQLIYDKDQNRVVALGAVQINYAGYKMVAQRVEYNQSTGRMMATGSIELIEPGGNRLYAETLDVTDDFADGFIEALRIETVDNTRLVAERGERINSNELVLYKGVYTACLPCADHPEKPPLWQVKAEKVIQNGQTHTVRMEKARFELFGKPIAYIPVLEVPDNTVKRKSGFLFPSMSTSENLGFGIKVPYYYVLSPTMDVTVEAGAYTNQGFLMDGEFRQILDNGYHVLRVAGIQQTSPSAFTSGTSDAMETTRGLVASEGRFQINPRWSFGWDLMMQSDNNFARTYKVFDFNKPIHNNKVFLTGLGDRNYFDMRAFYFDVQDADPDSKAERRQAVVHPVMDYHYISDEPVLGGQLSATVNMQNISRDRFDVKTVSGFNRFQGLEGVSSRLTGEAEWKRTLIMPGGLVVTPLVAARADGLRLDTKNPNNYSSTVTYTGDYLNEENATRTMLTAGLEARYPFMIATATSNHILEPIVQVYARPDEQLAGRLPNEDSQSFVYDATTLFERDKFSGFDRIEGGTRANIGLRYSGTFADGYVVHGVMGQSYQLAGRNSFASSDLVNVGANSGLETDISDYVGMVSLDMPNGLTFSSSNRFDEKSLKLQRSDASIAYNGAKYMGSVTYSKIGGQPEYGLATNNDEIQAAGAIKIKDFWTLSASITWDINNAILTKRGVGLSYEDGCTTFALVYTQTSDVADTSASDWQIGARLSFRTLGDIDVGETKLDGL